MVSFEIRSFPRYECSRELKQIWRINPKTGLKELQMISSDVIPKSLKRDGWKFVTVIAKRKNK